jgi:heat shock protein HslJ
VELQGEAIASSPEGTPAHLAFQAADSTVSGSGGCNRLFGPFHLQGAAGLRFGNLASTQMACPNMALEGRLHAALPTVDGYALRGDTLVMLHGEQVVALWGKGE